MNHFGTLKKKGLRTVILSVFWLQALTLSAQNTDSMRHENPGIPVSGMSSSQPRPLPYLPDSISTLRKTNELRRLVPKSGSVFGQNQLLNKLPAPVQKRYRERDASSADTLFYILAAMGILLGIFRTAYPGYFNNLFRVFFNTSLRQNQLTDQLLQAPLPSLFFNIFFILSASLLIYLYLGHYDHLEVYSSWKIFFMAMACLSGIYLIKYCFFKFVGWVSGMSTYAGSYIFVVFLVNKILGICFFPLLPLIAFSRPEIASMAVTTSLILWILLMAIRLLKTYGLVSGSLQMNRFHFVLYTLALEIIPLLSLIKCGQILLDKKL
jgi:hypothetical protein